MALADQVFVVLLVPLLALIPQVSIAALKKLGERHERDADGEDTLYFGL